MPTAIDLFVPGRTAAITGAASGIGAAAARHFAGAGLRLCLFDRDAAALEKLAERVRSDHGVDVVTVVGDVTSAADLGRFADAAFASDAGVAVLMNNAGIAAGGGPWAAIADWRLQIETNLLSMVVSQGLFVPRLLEQAGRAAIINLGSKQGITTPPGNAAYNAAKAGVKVLTEQLAHELRERVGEQITAHLLVPGFTWTGMNGAHESGVKPADAWTADQVIAHLDRGLRAGDFYIVCPDNAVTPALDKKRMRWASDDVIEGRPALSRWHSAWKDRFAAFVGSD